MIYVSFPHQQERLDIQKNNAGFIGYVGMMGTGGDWEIKHKIGGVKLSNFIWLVGQGHPSEKYESVN